MRIPLPWPAPKPGEAFPHEAAYCTLNQEIKSGSTTKGQLLIIDLFTEEGLFIADWEAKLWDWRQRHAEMTMILQVTALPPALIFPDNWGITAYLIHGPTWEHLHGLSPPPALSTPPYVPRRGWYLIGPDYEPPPTALQTLNAFLKDLQAWRRTLSIYYPEKSSLFYTVADQVYTHFSRTELDSYVASVRR